MRAVIGLISTFVAALLLSATVPAQAQRHEHWCLRGDTSAPDCSFNSLAQCKAARGAGGAGTCFRARRSHAPTPGR
jgi:uncharacterized low-complexity protein